MNNLGKLVENGDNSCGICLEYLVVGIDILKYPFTWHSFWDISDSGYFIILGPEGKTNGSRVLHLWQIPYASISTENRPCVEDIRKIFAKCHH